ncbi:MAG TPA: hypothetical protein VJS92_11115 [Candidatus Polarisedimenticolaceae bacterium]|nr:hypothetical protein [Candidatus Polarisedimenticolaceae bacterium]
MRRALPLVVALSLASAPTASADGVEGVVVWTMRGSMESGDELLVRALEVARDHALLRESRIRFEALRLQGEDRWFIAESDWRALPVDVTLRSRTYLGDSFAELQRLVADHMVAPWLADRDDACSGGMTATGSEPDGSRVEVAADCASLRALKAGRDAGDRLREPDTATVADDAARALVALTKDLKSASEIEAFAAAAMMLGLAGTIFHEESLKDVPIEYALPPAFMLTMPLFPSSSRSHATLVSLGNEPHPEAAYRLLEMLDHGGPDPDARGILLGLRALAKADAAVARARALPLLAKAGYERRGAVGVFAVTEAKLARGLQSLKPEEPEDVDRAARCVLEYLAAESVEAAVRTEATQLLAAHGELPACSRPQPGYNSTRPSNKEGER